MFELNIIAGTVLAIATAWFIIWFFGKLTKINLHS